MTTKTTGIEVSYLSYLESARFLEKTVLLAVKERDMTSAFFLLIKLQSFVLSFLLTSMASEPSYQIGVQSQEYLSILLGIDKAIYWECRDYGN
jgi:hypothetical protein